MDRVLAWTSVASMLGLAGMAIVAVVVQPPTVALQDLADHVGQTVIVDARVVRFEGRETWTRLRLADDNRSIDAIVDGVLNVSTGDQVRVQGRVESASNVVRLRVDHAQDVAIIQTWREGHVPLDHLVRNPWLFIDTHVVTSGRLERGTLVTFDDRLRVSTIVGPDLGAIPLGDDVLLGVLVEYEEESGRVRLRIMDVAPLDG